MKINITKLIQGKLRQIIFDFYFNKHDIPVRDKSIIFKGDLRVTGSIIKFKDNFLLDGNINTIIQLECSSCFEKFCFDISEQINIIYKNIKLKEEDEDSDKYYSYFEGTIIDLTEDIRQLIILNLPFYPLCKKDCLGLCQNCGENLNFGRCNCDEDEIAGSMLSNLLREKVSTK